MKSSGNNPQVPPPGGGSPDDWGDPFKDPASEAPTRIVTPQEASALAKKGAPAAPKAPKAAQGLAADVPVQVVCVLGRKNVSVSDLLRLKDGEVVELDRFPQDAVDLVVGGKLMAKGELIEIDGRLGVRIVKTFFE